MKAIVTGATGFLGEKLALRLNQEGFDVLAVGRNIKAGKKLEHQGIRFCPLDLRNREEVLRFCANTEYYFHCAALSSPWGSYEDFYDHNVIATRNLLDAAQNAPTKKFIHISSPSIYFDFTDKFNIKELDPLPKASCNHYAATKLLAEKKVDQAFLNGVPTVTLRPRGIIGAGDTAIIPRLLRAHQEGGIPLINQGNAVVDLTHVENVVEAILLCISGSKEIHGEKFNITNSEPLRFKEIVEILNDTLQIKLATKTVPYLLAYASALFHEYRAKILRNREPPFTRYSVGVISKSQTLDISKATKLLGYTPKKSLLEAFMDYGRYNEN